MSNRTLDGGRSPEDNRRRARWYEACAVLYVEAARVREGEYERRTKAFDLWDPAPPIAFRVMRREDLRSEALECRRAALRCRRWAARLDAWSRGP